MWVLVFPETVTKLSTPREAGQIPYNVRGGRKAGVCRWSGFYAGAWAGEGTTVFDRWRLLSCHEPVAVVTAEFIVHQPDFSAPACSLV